MRMGMGGMRLWGCRTWPWGTEGLLFLPLGEQKNRGKDKRATSDDGSTKEPWKGWPCSRAAAKREGGEAAAAPRSCCDAEISQVHSRSSCAGALGKAKQQKGEIWGAGERSRIRGSAGSLAQQLFGVSAQSGINDQQLSSPLGPGNSCTASEPHERKSCTLGFSWAGWRFLGQAAEEHF